MGYDSAGNAGLLVVIANCRFDNMNALLFWINRQSEIGNWKLVQQLEE